MAFTINVNNDDNHSLTFSKNILARRNEANVSVTVVVPAAVFALGSFAYIDFILPDGSTYFKGDYDPSSGSFTFTLGSADTILSQDGKIGIQFVLRDSDVLPTVVWKSELKYALVGSSADATAQALTGIPTPATFPTTFPAANVSITDAGGHFASPDVEDALQEVGVDIGLLEAEDLALQGQIANLGNYDLTLDTRLLNIEETGLKNLVINGGFDVWQRGTSQTAAGFGSDDRWENYHSGSTKTHSRQAFTAGQTSVPNNPLYYSRTIAVTGSGAAHYITKTHKIEDVTKFSGKNVAISFWAKADASKNMSIEFVQNFGSGGSASVTGQGIEKFALTSSWQRFTKTVALPSVTGKTIGEGNRLEIVFWMDAGSDLNARTNSLGNQSGTFDIANVSLVMGSEPMEFIPEPYGDTLRKCQRYLYKLYAANDGGEFVRIGHGFAKTTTTAWVGIHLPTVMRIKPTLSLTGNLVLSDGTTNTSLTALAIEVDASSDSYVELLATVAAGLTAFRPYVLLRDSLASTAFLTAEL